MELLIGIVIIGVVLFFVFGFGAKAGVNVAKEMPRVSPPRPGGDPVIWAVLPMESTS